MSDQPTGAHPPADGYPRDPLAEPTLPSDALSSEPYPSEPSEPSESSESEPHEAQREGAPTAVTEPVPHEQTTPPVPPAPDMTPAPPVPAPAVPSGFDAGPSNGRPADAAKAGKMFSPVLKRVGVALIAVVVVVLGRTAFDRGSADVLEVGQCVSRDGNEIAQIDCADELATFKVLLIQKDTTESSIESVCSGAPTTTTSYFESKEGETQGNVICLSDLP
ncbi:MAG: hypothetical protein ABIQ53_11780 [Terracoccus sp.]